MNYTNIFMVRGDTLWFKFTVEGLTSDLDSAYFSCRKDVETNAVNYVFQKLIGDGITKVETTDTSITYEVVVAPEDTENVDIGNYYYDLQLTKDGEVMTPFIGVLNINYDVTRPSNLSV